MSNRANFAVSINFAPEIEVATDPSGTTDIGTPDSNRIVITGGDDISSFGAETDQYRIVRFAGNLTLHNDPVALILLGGVDRQVSVGDVGQFLSDADGNWLEMSFFFASLSPGGMTTGDVKATLKTSPDVGWIMFDDGAIGSAASGASSRANADCQALFTLLYGVTADADVPLLTSVGGATTRGAQGSAAAAWAANCQMTLPKTLGRALAVSGAASGLTARNLGAILGEEKHTMTTAELAAHTHSVSETNVNNLTAGPSQGPGDVNPNSGDTATVTGPGPGSATPFNVMQPTTFLNLMVKL